MATKTSIINLALTGLGASNIADITDDNSETARKCLAVYDNLLASMLRSHPWGFAKKESTLSMISTSPILTDDFAYIYNLPPDFIRLLKTDAEPTYSHKIKGRKLYSNVESIKIEYIYLCTDTTQYDESFINAFAARIAAELAYAITSDLNISKMKWQEFDSKLREAKSINGQESTPDEPQMDEYLNSRII